MVIASIVGVWLFWIQHRYQHVQWMPEASWSFAEAAFGGISYLRLPRLLQWFTGNTGFTPRAPCEPADPELSARGMPQCRCRVSIDVNAYLRTALQALRYALWDSDLERLVPFRFAAAG
jgi:acyl-lipid omega-6 desaturase (Delta-12 desaturase)